MTTRNVISRLLTFAAVAMIAHCNSDLASADEIIYEGFDYGTGNVVGENGGTGFTGAWASNNVWMNVTNPGSTWGSLDVNGGKLTSITRSGISRPIGSTLADANMLIDGGTLWFSAIVDISTGSGANSNLAFALTNSAGFFAPASDPEWHYLEDDGTTTDEGIGFAYRAFGSIGAAYWQDDDAGADVYSERVLNTTNMVTGLGSALIVGKIVWGANGTADELLTLYAPDPDLNLGAPILENWAIPALDQSSFDNIAIMGKDTPSIDEIRFGATYADVAPAIPEPSTFTIGFLGLLGLVGFRRRNR